MYIYVMSKVRLLSLFGVLMVNLSYNNVMCCVNQRVRIYHRVWHIALITVKYMYALIGQICAHSDAKLLLRMSEISRAGPATRVYNTSAMDGD